MLSTSEIHSGESNELCEMNTGSLDTGRQHLRRRVLLLQQKCVAS